MTLGLDDYLADEYGLNATARSRMISIAYVGGGTTTVTMLLSVLGLLRGPRKKQKEDIEDKEWLIATEPTVDVMLGWIDDDSPVSDPTGDRFGTRKVARRMALRALSKEKPPAQALVGKLGSGKTTVLRLFKHYLATHQQPHPTEVICVELWPYATSQAAVEGVLRSLVEVFADRISTSQLEGLPAAYGTAIAKAGGVENWLPTALKKEVPPAAVIRAFDDVAFAIRRRYIVWVEDLERFAAGDPAAAVTDSELERLAPIRALLHGLDTSRSFTIVTATTDLYRRFDLEKIARYTERLHEIPIWRVRAVISAVRLEWLRDSTLIDPVSQQERGSFGWERSNEMSSDRAGMIEFLDARVDNLAAAVSALATTPRTLKQGLRRARETWTTLKGEIDLDDALALSILTESQPAAVALIEREIASLQRRTIRIGKDRDKSPLADFDEKLKALNLEPLAHSAVSAIVAHVFGDRAERRPQGLRWNHHTDYWERFHAVPRVQEIDSDQALLRILRDKDDSRVLELLCDEDRSRGVEDFASVLPYARLIALLGKLVSRNLGTDPTAWPERHSPGLVPLWRMLRQQRSDRDLDRLASEVERAVDTASSQLPLLQDIVYWFATRERQIEPLLSDVVCERIHARAHLRFLQGYADQPAKLAESLRGGSPLVLLWLCWRIERVRDQSMYSGVPFEEWSDLVPTLLEALSLRPSIMAPQLAPFVVRESRRFRGPDQWVFNETQCETLFGDVSAFVGRMTTAARELPHDPRIEAVVLRRKSEDVEDEPDGPEDDGPADEYSRASQSDDVDDDSDHGPAGTSFGSLEERSQARHDGTASISAFSDALGYARRVDGFWVERLILPSEGLPQSGQGALLPEKHRLADGCYCLDLITLDSGGLAPLSSAAFFTFEHSAAFARREAQHFVAAESPSQVYEVRFVGELNRHDVRARFGEQAGHEARADRATALLAARRIGSLEEVRSLSLLLGQIAAETRTGETQASLEATLAWLEARLISGQNLLVDAALRSIDAKKTDPAILVAVLSITLPMQKSLHERHAFLSRAEATMREKLGDERTVSLLEHRR